MIRRPHGQTLLVIGPAPPPWTGMEVATAALLEELDRAHIPTIHVNTADPEDHPGNRGRWTLRNIVMAARHIRLVLRHLVVDTVRTVYVPISQERPAFLRDAMFMLMARGLRKRIVVHLHGGAFCDFYAREHWIMRSLIRATVGKADVGIVLSPRLRSALDCVVPRERVISVLLGVRFEPHAGSLNRARRRTHKRRVLLLSNLFPSKGVGIFIEALALVHQTHGDVVGTIAGTWPTREIESEMRSMTTTLGLERWIEFTGSVAGQAKVNVLEQADIFCLPTFYPLEGTPIVIMEAMAAGLPVVTTAWRGIPDIVEDGVTGYVLPRPSPELIASRLLLLLDNEGLRISMGNAACCRYHQLFTQDAFGRRIVPVLTQTLS